MRLANFVTIICIVFILSFMGLTAEAQGTCGLANIDEGSSNDRYVISLVSDYLVNRTLIWQHRFFGQVSKTSATDNPDFRYVDATHTTSYYRMYSNSRTRFYPRDMNKREITRDVLIECKDGTSSRYYLKVPLQDMTPPEFSQAVYTLSIKSGWNIQRPISEGQFIIVNDNDYELGKENSSKMLNFHVSVDNLLNITWTKLWIAPNPEKYYYRLDMFLQEDSTRLPLGKNEVMLSALDDFNAGFTKIEIIAAVVLALLVIVAAVSAGVYGPVGPVVGYAPGGPIGRTFHGAPLINGYYGGLLG
ncbi:hypothetical protein Ocin01_07643 [Orchesella cincta]|uniref:DUF2207 domain-containing protein n=1 Tax=Orchesella cincta TaxID=48709 RepID=A0A1D2N1W6_ORCCI|nr:hypothetical protein Ocin01_07643 [Orchesella cincta]